VRNDRMRSDLPGKFFRRRCPSARVKNPCHAGAAPR
jgi:hypothetical protein